MQDQILKFCVLVLNSVVFKISLSYLFIFFVRVNVGKVKMVDITFFFKK